MRTNEEMLVELSVVGEISNPPIWGWRVDTEGKPRVLPGVGGIAYNVKVGMTAVHWKADHVEPGVSAVNFNKQFNDTGSGFNVLSQVGNRARVISGDAKGREGIVTGKHGGVDHVMIDFDDDTLNKLSVGDKIQVRGYGLGLELRDFPNVTLMNMDPALPQKLRVRAEKGKLIVPVHMVVPAAVMGSGLGNYHSYSGDYDIQLFCPKTNKEYGLYKLRLGDIVAIPDADARYGRSYHRGRIVIGIVVHSCSTVGGHGPGVTTLFTGRAEDLGYEISERANIAFALGVGTARKKSSGSSRSK